MAAETTPGTPGTTDHDTTPALRIRGLEAGYGATRVLRPEGTALPNLFAAGGAACGVSGARAGGYLSGNGLLTAVALGRLAGQGAGACVAIGTGDPGTTHLGVARFRA